ncbi:MAG: lysophospholipid acyltransferase family protein [Bacteroidales bacterium]|nr:lysophospholipid acyltransferase family protein [Bacteroidales bacterium]
MILTAKHNFIIYSFFQKFAKRLIKKHFKTSQIIGNYDRANKPVLVLSNHISWWDGFWIMYLNLNKIHKKYHFMMLEDQLKKYWFFNYTGGFSVNKSSKSIIESLKYSADLLKDSNNMVLIFPQGKINSVYEQKINFQKGIEWILKKTENEIEIIFVANLIDNFSDKKPNIYMHIEVHSSTEFKNYNIEQAYNIFYKKSVDEQKKFAY